MFGASEKRVVLLKNSPTQVLLTTYQRKEVLPKGCQFPDRPVS